jgi:hypothetical protein
VFGVREFLVFLLKLSRWRYDFAVVNNRNSIQRQVWQTVN